MKKSTLADLFAGIIASSATLYYAKHSQLLWTGIFASESVFFAGCTFCSAAKELSRRVKQPLRRDLPKVKTAMDTFVDPAPQG
jgi:protein involved in ribonucleotide reduction